LASKRKKGALDDVVLMLVSLILLVIFVWLLISIWGTVFNPDLQTSVLNTDLLRSKINEACAGSPNKDVPAAVLKGFALPQPKPLSLLGVDFLPAFAIKSGGDPHYVLYYESFAPGDATGWEVFHKDFGYRFIAPFEYPPDKINSDGGIPDTGDFIKQLNDYAGIVSQEAQDKFPDTANKNVVLVNNVILTQALNVIPNQKPRAITEIKEQPEPTTGNLGKWASTNKFEFFGYSTLASVDRTLIKYRPCGTNALCLKTRDAVYKFPLDEKACGNVKYVELVYDARGNRDKNLEKAFGWTAVGAGGSAALYKAAGSTFLKVVSKFVPSPVAWVSWAVTIGGIAYSGYEAAAHFMATVVSYKVSDFNLASPCRINSDVQIYKQPCKSLQDDYKCDKMIKYPMYEYEVSKVDGKVTAKKAGDHYACVDKIQNIDEATSGKVVSTDGMFSSDDMCIRIQVNNMPDGFCWTPDPYKSDGSFFTKNIFTQTIESVLGLSPTVESTDYLKNTNAIALVPPDVYKQKLENWLEVFERKWWWAWPG